MIKHSVPQMRPLPYKEIALKACSACEDANHRESHAHVKMPIAGSLMRIVKMPIAGSLMRIV